MKTNLNRLLPVLVLGSSAIFYSLNGCSRVPEAPPKAIQLHVDDRIKFDITAFEVKPGQKVSVTLSNVGTTPKFSMGHNFVLLDRNANIQNFLDAGSTQASHDYVPPDAKGVIAHTKLLGPGESDTATFDAPYVPGDYPYFCSFPGHYAQGARGIMTVK